LKYQPFYEPVSSFLIFDKSLLQKTTYFNKNKNLGIDLLGNLDYNNFNK